TSHACGTAPSYNNFETNVGTSEWSSVNQKKQKTPLPHHRPWTGPGQPLDAPDYKHPILPCHINRIDSSHKKFNYSSPQPHGIDHSCSGVAHPCGFCKGGSFCCLEVL